MTDNDKTQEDAFKEYYNDKRKEIEELGLNAIKDYFKIDPRKLDDRILKHLHNRARLAMQFEKEMNISRRAIETNYIRVFKLIVANKEEMRKYIIESLPKYAPQSLKITFDDRRQAIENMRNLLKMQKNK